VPTELLTRPMHSPKFATPWFDDLTTVNRLNRQILTISAGATDADDFMQLCGKGSAIEVIPHEPKLEIRPRRFTVEVLASLRYDPAAAGTRSA
jgi:hypothetical protein